MLNSVMRFISVILLSFLYSLNSNKINYEVPITFTSEHVKIANYKYSINLWEDALHNIPNETINHLKSSSSLSKSTIPDNIKKDLDKIFTYLNIPCEVFYPLLLNDKGILQLSANNFTTPDWLDIQRDPIGLYSIQKIVTDYNGNIVIVFSIDGDIAISGESYQGEGSIVVHKYDHQYNLLWDKKIDKITSCPNYDDNCNESNYPLSVNFLDFTFDNRLIMKLHSNYIDWITINNDFYSGSNYDNANFLILIDESGALLDVENIVNVQIYDIYSDDEFIYFTGGINSTAFLGPIVLESLGQNDMLLAKYGYSGFDWAIREGAYNPSNGEYGTFVSKTNNDELVVIRDRPNWLGGTPSCGWAGADDCGRILLYDLDGNLVRGFKHDFNQYQAELIDGNELYVYFSQGWGQTGYLKYDTLYAEIPEVECEEGAQPDCNGVCVQDSQIDQYLGNGDGGMYGEGCSSGYYYDWDEDGVYDEIYPDLNCYEFDFDNGECIYNYDGQFPYIEFDNNSSIFVSDGYDYSANIFHDSGKLLMKINRDICFIN